MATQTKRLALFKTEYGSYVEAGEWAEKDSYYGRVSEYVDVEFPLLPEETVIQNQVVAIDHQIEKIKDDAMSKVSELQTKKAELLALTHGEQS